MLNFSHKFSNKWRIFNKLSISARRFKSAKYGHGYRNLMLFPKVGMNVDSPQVVLKDNDSVSDYQRPIFFSEAILSNSLQVSVMGTFKV